MIGRWDDVNARARGRAGHLLDREALLSVATAGDLGAVARRLAEHGISSPEGASAAALELAVRRAAGAELTRLFRWLDRRSLWLNVIFDDEDRRSLRALIRGAVAGVSAETRLSGLLPTPTLPERLLEELARQPGPKPIAALLTVWQHPYGPPILRAGVSDMPDLFAIEHELDHAFALRATQGGRRGGRALRAYVAETIDLDNVRGALVLAAGRSEVDPVATYLPGGRWITRETFIAGATTSNPTAAAQYLARQLKQPAFAQVVRAHATTPATLEPALLHARVAALRVEARRDPLGPAPLLGYFLRLRGQVSVLRGVIWGTVLGVPVSQRRERVERSV